MQSLEGVGQRGTITVGIFQIRRKSTASNTFDEIRQAKVQDLFGDASLVPAMLQKVGCNIGLEQRTHAEEDIAVAAASIIARSEFVKQIAKLSKLVDISLLKGASNPDIIAVGREIVAREGKETLGKVAKLHFKITQAIL